MHLLLKNWYFPVTLLCFVEHHFGLSRTSNVCLLSGQVILKGIDKGDILSSGAPQIMKDGPVGRSLNDLMQSSRTKLGTAHSEVNQIFLLHLVSAIVLSNAEYYFPKQAVGKIYSLLLTTSKMKVLRALKVVIQIIPRACSVIKLKMLKVGFFIFG